MGSFSLFHWIVVLAFLTLPFPIGKILKRDGLNPFWSLLYFVPLANLIGLWIWAYKRRSAD